MGRSLEMNFRRGADAAIEVDQIRTASEQDVLTVIENLAGLRIVERSSAPAERAARFQQRDGKPRIFKRHRRRHPGESAANDDDAPLLSRLPIRVLLPLPLLPVLLLSPLPVRRERV